MGGLVGGGSPDIPAPTTVTPSPTVVEPTDRRIDDARRRRIATAMTGEMDRPTLGMSTLLGQNQRLGV